MTDTPLLYAQSTPGLCGVDLPETSPAPVRTGVPSRDDLDLPEVSEPQIIRHFTRLSQMNYSIDTHFYPLGSCTMKHNPRLNEQLARLPGFAYVHPLQPESTVQGSLALIHTLEQWLIQLTGLPKITLNPAAGAHGELTGMMMIKKAHKKRGKSPTFVLIPDSAHGTNPATAIMCGYQTLSVPTGNDGMVDLSAFNQLIEQYGDKIAAFMLTNPNTCGLFEKDIQKIAKSLHNIGAYLYMDGANFNAIVGKIKPADLGIDVMQMNLHKTFSTPHGGGGPGCGPVAVTEELGEFLPVPRVIHENGHYSLEKNAENSIGRMKSFHGHFGMFVRALAYMMSHGSDGLQAVSEGAVLNANYLFHNLKKHYHAPFPGPCMHECLLTDKHQKKEGVSTLDIAKALIDENFHPFTMYFPLVTSGSMLIEPTETEDKNTLDSFIEAMVKIAEKAPKKGENWAQKPEKAPRQRADEVQAAKQPILTWQMSQKKAQTK